MPLLFPADLLWVVLDRDQTFSDMLHIHIYGLCTACNLLFSTLRFTLMLTVKEAKWVTYYSVYIVLVNTHIAR